VICKVPSNPSHSVILCVVHPFNATLIPYLAVIIPNEELLQRDLSYSGSHKQFCLRLLSRYKCGSLFNYYIIQFSSTAVLTCDEFELYKFS